MNKPKTFTTSSQPWYRQFWPWFLIALPGTVVVAAFYTLYLANRHADDLVVDDYYKEGLAINRELGRQQRADELGISAQVSNEGQHLVVDIDGPVTAPQLRLLLSHPMEAEQDITLPIQRTGSGRYEINMPKPIEGRWHWIIDAGDGSEWRIDGNRRF